MKYSVQFISSPKAKVLPNRSHFRGLNVHFCSSLICHKRQAIAFMQLRNLLSWILHSPCLHLCLIVIPLSQETVVILHGDRTANVQNPVEVESNLEGELVPIHLQVPEERTAMRWDQGNQAENATIKTVQARSAISCI